MAKYRMATLLPSESVTTAGTKTIDLDVVEPISMISMVMKATPAGTIPTDHPAANVTKIEIVDGSDVIASLSGKECQALDFYDTRFMPNNHVSDGTSVIAWATCNLRFGRELFDTELALDPTKFRNPQLKVTHNYRVADTAASAATLEIYAHMFDEKKITPIGYLRATEIYSYTNGVSGTIETIDLPRDLPIRQMLINTYGDTFKPWQIANKVKISENGGAKIPYDFSSSAWLKVINQMYPLAVEKCWQANAAASRHLFCGPSFEVHPSLISEVAGAVVSQALLNEAPALHITSSAAGALAGYVTGFNPHGAFPIPFGDQTDFNDWYDPRPLGSLKMEITGGTAGISGSSKIVLQQLKRY